MENARKSCMSCHYGHQDTQDILGLTAKHCEGCCADGKSKYQRDTEVRVVAGMMDAIQALGRVGYSVWNWTFDQDIDGAWYGGLGSRVHLTAGRSGILVFYDHGETREFVLRLSS